MSFLPSHWGMYLNMERTTKRHLNQRGRDNMINGTCSQIFFFGQQDQACGVAGFDPQINSSPKAGGTLFLYKHANGPWFGICRPLSPGLACGPWVHIFIFNRRAKLSSSPLGSYLSDFLFSFLFLLSSSLFTFFFFFFNESLCYWPKIKNWTLMDGYSGIEAQSIELLSSEPKLVQG